jgi:hypothetical protein
MYFTSAEEAAKKFVQIFKKMQWRWRGSDVLPTEEELIQQFMILEESIREKKPAKGAHYASSTSGRIRVSKLQGEVANGQFLYHLNPRDQLAYEAYTDERVTYIEFLEEDQILNGFTED